MAGIGGIGGAAGAAGANPLSGMVGNAGTPGGGALSGLADMGIGTGGDGGGAGADSGLGIGPTRPASETQAASFGDTLRAMVIQNPSASKAHAGNLAVRFAANEKGIDAHDVSIASAKAGVEIQMATRTISSAVSAVRTLFQMQV